MQQHDLLKFGIIPELIGRMPVITALASLSREDMVRILKEPKNALTKQYQALMQFDNVELEFEDEALGKIADKAIAMEIGAPRPAQRHGRRHDGPDVLRSVGPDDRQDHHHRGERGRH